MSADGTDVRSTADCKDVQKGFLMHFINWWQIKSSPFLFTDLGVCRAVLSTYSHFSLSSYNCCCAVLPLLNMLIITEVILPPLTSSALANCRSVVELTGVWTQNLLAASHRSHPYSPWLQNLATQTQYKIFLITCFHKEHGEGREKCQSNKCRLLWESWACKWFVEEQSLNGFHHFIVKGLQGSNFKENKFFFPFRLEWSHPAHHEAQSDMWALLDLLWCKIPKVSTVQL